MMVFRLESILLRHKAQKLAILSRMTLVASLSQKFIIGALFLVQLLGGFSVQIANLIVPNSQVIIDLIIELHEGPMTERASTWKHKNCPIRADSGASNTLLSVTVERCGSAGWFAFY